MENELLIQAISQILQNEASEDTLKIKNKILERIASEADIKPSRIQAPLNITQIGGYINLLRKLDKEERERQINSEGWTPEHDDEHIHEELVAAAICYLLGNLYGNTKQNVPSLWPWDEKYWKPEGKTFSPVTASFG